MKTVCVFATIVVGEKEMDVMENAVFGKKQKYQSANEFIIQCRNMWKAHTTSWKITNVVIEG